MSNDARIAIALVALFFAGMFATSAMTVDQKQEGMWGLAAFCVAVIFACIRGKGGRIALRGVAACVFATYCVYVIWAATLGDAVPHPDSVGLLQALVGLLIWGLLFGYIALFGVCPPWALFAHGVREEANESISESEIDPDSGSH